jgi:hypothetical protein
MTSPCQQKLTKWVGANNKAEFFETYFNVQWINKCVAGHCARRQTSASKPDGLPRAVPIGNTGGALPLRSASTSATP